MANTKFSQIAPAGAIGATDNVVGLQGGTTADVIFTMSLLATFFWTSPTLSSPVVTGLLAMGDTTSASPALKKSSTVLQARLADDSAFAPLQGKLRTDANATTGLVAGVLSALTNASITITDASGQVYRVPVII